MTTVDLVAVDAIGFNDGGTGHVYTFPAGAPAAGDWDVLCINSDTTVATPSGFTVGPTTVADQGAYIFRRQAVSGEAPTVTVTTSGNFNTTFVWSRWRNAGAADSAKFATAGPDFGSSTPPVTTDNPLASTNELVVAFAALHGFAGGHPGPSDPVWSAGYAPLATGPLQGDTGAQSGQSTMSFVGYRVDAGTAAETPSVTWTDLAAGRYMMVLTFAPNPGVQAIPGGPAAPGGPPAAAALAAGVLTLDAVPAGPTPTGTPAALTTGQQLAALPATPPASAGRSATFSSGLLTPPAVRASVVVRTLTGAVTIH